MRPPAGPPATLPPATPAASTTTTTTTTTNKDSTNKDTAPPTHMPSSRYSLLTTIAACESLAVSPAAGLDPADAAARRKTHGANELDVADREHLLSKFAEQFQNPLILLLVASAIVSLCVGNIEDAISISLAVIIVLTVAFLQERQSEKSLDALNRLTPHHCRLKRNGKLVRAPASDLVPGDIVAFEHGDRIPADLRLIESVHLDIDESSLTGENEPVRKHTDPITEYRNDIPLTERSNIAFMGTLVRNGRGTGIVIATGMHSEIGLVFSMMKNVETRKTPLQSKMDDLGKHLSAASFAVIALISLVGVIQGRGWLQTFTIAVSLAVAAIPEGLPIVVTVTLALGVLRMASHNAIVKKLPSVECLGSVNVVCVDKTGTLTMNKMVVTKIYTMGDGALIDTDPNRRHNDTLHDKPNTEIYRSSSATTLRSMSSSASSTTAAQLLAASNSATAAIEISSSACMRQLIRITNICNNAQKDQLGKMVGQPSEVAIMELVDRIGFPDARLGEIRVSEVPFNADRKWMSVESRPAVSVTDSPNSATPTSVQSVPTLPTTHYVKGALEPVLSVCRHYYVSDTECRELKDTDRRDLKSRENDLAGQGLRVLAIAYGTTSRDLIFVGLIAMYDAPRAGIIDTIQQLVSARIKVVMLTGDSEGTARAIAQQVHIPMNPTDVMSGTEIEQSTRMQLIERVPSIAVFYRMTPAHKLAIIEAYQATGAIVAMTGDGVNDAPALRLADIGISMGQHGTDVAKEAADMILVNDDLATIVHAIEQGKSIFHNIQNFLCFQLGVAISALTLVALSTVFGYENPLNAMQILWINIICDGPVAQSLGIEDVDPDVMRQPPRHKNEPIVTRSVVTRIVVSASVMVIGTLLVFIHSLDRSGVVDSGSGSGSGGASTGSDGVMVPDSMLGAITATTDWARLGTVTAHGRTLTFTCFVFFGMWNSLGCRSGTRLIHTIGVFTNRMYIYAVTACVIGQLVVVYSPWFQHVFQTDALSLREIFMLVCVTSLVFWIDEMRKLVWNMRDVYPGGHGHGVSGRSWWHAIQSLFWRHRGGIHRRRSGYEHVAMEQV